MAASMPPAEATLLFKAPCGRGMIAHWFPDVAPWLTRRRVDPVTFSDGRPGRPEIRGEQPMADKPDEPDDEPRERPNRGVKVRKLTEEERNARARALDELKAANRRSK
jgi:hypothetical protein